MNDEVRKYLSEIGRRGGKVSGGRKAARSRENGRRGYAPRPNKNRDVVKAIVQEEHKTLWAGGSLLGE